MVLWLFGTPVGMHIYNSTKTGFVVIKRVLGGPATEKIRDPRRDHPGPKRLSARRRMRC